MNCNRCKSTSIPPLSSLRKKIVCVLSAFIISVILGSVALAQTDDNIPPTITHSPSVGGIEAGTDFLITAEVTDNSAVGEVVVFYRPSGGGSFTSKQMSESGSSAGTYESTITGRMVTEPGIEYYITATDGSGNEQTRGFSFDPLQVSVVPATVQAKSSSANRTLLYVIGGALAVGALAALASGGGGGGEDSGIDGLQVPLVVLPPPPQ